MTFSLGILSFSIPFKAPMILTSRAASTVAPCFYTKVIAAFKVPPVASTSSTSTTLSPGFKVCLNKTSKLLLNLDLVSSIF